MSCKRKRAVIDKNIRYNDSDVWKQIINKTFNDNDNSYNKWVSASESANFVLNDPLLDWLKYYYNDLGLNTNVNLNNELELNTNNNIEITQQHKKIKINGEFEENIENKQTKITTNNNALLNLLFDKGNKFENLVNEFICKKFPNDNIVIATNGRTDCNEQNFNKTIDAMKKGIPIILQAVLINNTNKTRGVPDILIRSDYVNKLIKRKEVYDEDEYKKAPNLNGNYHYLVIDIKWSGLTLCANGRSIRNDGRVKAYKSQLALYNSIVGKIQGFTSRYCYILGKSWKIDASISQEGYDCFDLLGTIDYADFDNKYIKETCNAIDWLHNVRKNGKLWSPLKPEITEMYPNMSNVNDAPWSEIKKNIANSINEITQVWYVSQENRNNAVKQGVTKWSDPKCTIDILNINDGSRARTIKEILSINQQTDDFVRPKKIKNNDFNWQQQMPCDFMIDFETINDDLNSETIDINNAKKSINMIFMIGIGWIENNIWNYKDFTLNKYDSCEEKNIIDDLVNFIINKCKELDPTNIYKTRLFHWSQAEPVNFMYVNERHKNCWTKWATEIIWVDMYNIFIKEPIVIKDSLCFKLKEIGNALFKNKLISTIWDNSEISNGLTAMISAIKYYKKQQKNLLTSDDEITMNKIKTYNEIDCKVINDILYYLRNNNI